ncbi:MAG: thioesterase family protein [Alphaproteobacteria bacterium]|nr:thioesterase family protein [Alphaproteobacteria bacterium]
MPGICKCANLPAMPREDFNFHTTLRVRYAEIDHQGVVFNAHYLTYFDVGHTEYMRKIRYQYVERVKETQVDFHLVKSVVNYRQPIPFDTEIDVWVRTSRIGRTSFTVSYEIHSHGEEDLLASGETVMVTVNLADHRPVPVPDDFVEQVEEFEGHPVRETQA